ncbi:PLDc N-terminal domain-containing protein (plasmid) [Coraliomargarita sp. W4R53]
MFAKGSTMARKKDVSPAGRLVFGAFGLVQLSFAFLAYWDLAMRREREVVGPKWAWIPAIAVNWVGPASYFLFGIKR